MPYVWNDDLPLNVRTHLPDSAQTIYRHAFNQAWRTYRFDSAREEIAHRVAWSAVKKRYRKVDGDWVEKALVPE
jgi:cation transport regulator